MNKKPTHAIIVCNQAKEFTIYVHSNQELDDMKTTVKQLQLKIKKIITLERDTPEEGNCGKLSKAPCSTLLDHRCMTCIWIPNNF